MKICILVPTYNRNNSLIKLIKQLNTFLCDYKGYNSYSLCVTDSNPNNELSEIIKNNVSSYIINQGQGFDDNLWYFYKNHASNHDYVLSISDDDMFAISQINPLDIIDVAIKKNDRVILFNHFDSLTEENGLVQVLGRQYKSAAFSFNNLFLFHYFISSLPRHVGILYSVKVIEEHINKIALFRNTLHLYAVPFIIEAQNGGVVFFDYALFYFSDNQQNGGAWENKSAVFHGLMIFLKQSKFVLHADAYKIAKEGFFKYYLGDNSWLRRTLACDLPNQEYVMNYLNENELFCMKTKLLIYIPTYNRQHLLKKTLESIVIALHGFDFNHVKVHISNNASEDNTLEICRPFLNDQISVDSNPTNIGFVGNCVKGLQIDLGQEYTWMIGDDDLITPWSIRTLFTYLDELDKNRIQVKLIHVNLLVVSKEAKNDQNIFNLIKDKTVSGISWLMNSKFTQPCVVPFKAIVNPYVDDLILGTLMTTMFDSNLVREASKSIDYSHLNDSDWPSMNASNQAWFPFSFTFFQTFLRDDPCLVIPEIFSVCAFGHQGWIKDRSIVIAAALDGLFECFDREIINKEELEEYSKTFFVRHKHHLSDIIKNRIEVFSDTKREVLLKTYAWFVENHFK